MIKPAYLGDGVYASYDGYHIILSIDDGETKIYLDSGVQRSLLAYIESIRVETSKPPSDVPPLNPPV